MKDHIMLGNKFVLDIPEKLANFGYRNNKTDEKCMGIFLKMYTDKSQQTRNICKYRTIQDI